MPEITLNSLAELEIFKPAAADDPTPEQILSEAKKAEREGFAEVNLRMLTLRRVLMLADFAAASPVRWRAIRLHFFLPQASSADIAALLDISPAAARSFYGSKIKISEDVYADIPPTY